MEVSKPRIQLAYATVSIFSSSVLISISCWFQPYNDSYFNLLKFIALVFSIFLWPFSIAYSIAIESPEGLGSLTEENLEFFGVIMLITVLPWLVYFKTRSNLSLSIASIAWVFFGWLLNVGIYA